MTFTEDGSQKVKVSPTGPTEAARSLSVTPAVDSPRTVADKEIITQLALINKKFDLLLELVTSKRL